MRLRTFFLIGAILLALLGLGSAAGLLWTTSLLQRQTDILTTSLGRVRAADELRFSLFLLQVAHEAAEQRVIGVGPPITVAQAEAQVPERLRQVEQYTSSDQERALMAAARSRVEVYLKTDGPTRVEVLREAVSASETVVAASISRARTLQLEAQALSRTARLTGGLLSLSVVLGIALVLFIARSRIYLPLLSIRRALAAFKAGKRELRVDGTGAQELRELAAEFNDMAETLAAQEARHRQFLAGVVHDLRSPLHVLKLSAQVLLRGPELPPSDKVRESLVRSRTQLDRLERMVGDLMDQTRVEAGNLELQWEECDLRTLVADVVELHRPSSVDHELQLTLPDTPVPLRCDATRLSQVLTNLVSNAIKYSPEGGPIRVVLASSAEAILLSVSDLGMGVPPDERERIFEPFRRSPQSREGIPGIGLGLSVSRRIVRAHGGDIEVVDGEGGGSCFQVRLPRPVPAV